MRIKISCIFLFISLAYSAYGQELFPVKDPVSKLYGFKSAINTQWVIKPRYDRVEKFSNGYTIVSEKGLLGLINKKGKYVITPNYERLEGENYLTFKLKDTLGIIHVSGKVLVCGVYTHLYYEPSRGSAILMDKDRYGYWDTLNNFVPPISNYELAFEKGMAYFNSGEVKGFITKQGKKIIQVEEGDLWDVSPYGYISQRNGKECVYDSSGNLIRACDSIKIIQMRKNLILYEKDHRCKIMNYKGEDIFENDYESISPFNERGISIVKKNKKVGLIDESLQLIFPLENEYIDEYGKVYKRLFGKYENHLGYTLFKKGEHFGVVNDSGRVTIESKFSLASIDKGYLLNYVYQDTLGLIDLRNLKKIPLELSFQFVNNKTVFCLDVNGAQCGIANRQGKILVPPVYRKIAPMINGYSIVKNQYGAGILDTSGKEIVPLEYEGIKSLNDVYKEKYHTTGDVAWDGYLYVTAKDKLVGVADEKGKLIIDTIYKNVSAFDEECKCWFVQDKRNYWRAINFLGKKWPLKLDAPTVFLEGVAVAKKNKKSGIINVQGKNVVPFEFENIDPQEVGMYYFQKGTSWGLLTKSGKVVVAPVFKIRTPFINQHAFVKGDIGWSIIDTVGEINTLEMVKGLQDSSYARKIGDSRAMSISYNTLKGYDEMSVEMVIDHRFGQLINNFILDSKEAIFKEGEKKKEVVLLVDTCSEKSFSQQDYKGVGMEFLSITKNTFTINEFREESNGGINEVREEYSTYFVDGDSLVEISLEDIFSASDYLSVLNNLALSTLRNIGISVFEDTLVYKTKNFQLSNKGLILEVNKEVVPDIGALDSPYIIISFDEIRSIVKMDGPLKEFYE